METCLRVIVDGQTIKQIIGKIDCNPFKETIYFEWNWWIIGGGIVLLFIVLGIIWSIWLYPKWNVWASLKEGEAELQKAHNEQKIQITKAQSRKDAATLNKEAAIVEAEAVSEQITKIGAQLTEHDLYLKWQWIKMMEERPDSSVIYVPTEASMPILEAGKRKDNV